MQLTPVGKMAISAGSAGRREAMSLAVRRIVCVAVGVTAVASFSASASAHFDVGRYTHSTCSSGWVDPINVVFYGYFATPQQSEKAMEKYGGWYNQSGTTQVFWTHDICRPMYGQRASGSACCNRDHTRFFQNDGLDTKGRYETVADFHHDILTTCGHKNANPYGSDDGLAMANEILYGHLAESWQYWGNAARIRQCDGTYSGGTGYVMWALINAPIL
jgi:hypothetical protein